MTIRYGYHASPFGLALIMITDRRLVGCAFADPGGERVCFEDMAGRWPNADYIDDRSVTAYYVARIFDPSLLLADRQLRLVLLGTDFQVRVWKSLLNIPIGRVVTYSHIASDIGQPTAARAVGAAIGANPISFVVPCHRVVGKNGALTGYHWGMTRKRAMLDWEAGRAL